MDDDYDIDTAYRLWRESHGIDLRFHDTCYETANEWKQEKELLQAKFSVEAKKHDIKELPKTEEELTEFKEKYPMARTAPQILIDGERIGGHNELVQLLG